MSGDEKAEREERLRAALRENLRRRKAQARGRKVPDDRPADEPATRSEPSADRRNDG